jgi:hypothetical protein
MPAQSHRRRATTGTRDRAPLRTTTARRSPASAARRRSPPTSPPSARAPGPPRCRCAPAVAGSRVRACAPSGRCRSCPHRAGGRTRSRRETRTLGLRGEEGLRRPSARCRCSSQISSTVARCTHNDARYRRPSAPRSGCAPACREAGTWSRFALRMRDGAGAAPRRRPATARAGALRRGRTPSPVLPSRPPSPAWPSRIPRPPRSSVV